jgi:small subunit ribosomal protein S1
MSNDSRDDFGAILERFERQQKAGGTRRADGRPEPQIQRLEPGPPPSTRRYQKPAQEEDFAQALAAFERDHAERAPRRREAELGQTISGTILALDLETAFIDIGGKTTAQLPTQELTESDGVLSFQAGDAITAEVVGFERETGAPRLRLIGRAGAPGSETASSKGRAAVEVGAIVSGLVQSANKGGVEVEVGSRRAFCPFSQLDIRRVDDATVFVGQRLTFQVTRVEQGGKNLVLSRRAVLEAEQAQRAAAARATLEVGSVVRGKVTALADYGVFVELGDGVEGLLHISELSFQRIKHPQEMVAVGQTLEVKILKIDHGPDGRDRISLSHKALGQDPWLLANQRFAEGASFRGKVTRLESFGAFVEIEPGVEGLIHLSELGGGRRLNHPREVLKVGQELDVRVQGLDLAKKRISLLPLAEGEGPEAAADVRRHLAEVAEQKPGLGTLAHFFQKVRS